MVNELVGFVGEADGVRVPLDLQALQPVAVLSEGLHDLIHVHPALHLQEPPVGRAQHTHPETAANSIGLRQRDVTIFYTCPERVSRARTLKQPQSEGREQLSCLPGPHISRQPHTVPHRNVTRTQNTESGPHIFRQPHTVPHRNVTRTQNTVSGPHIFRHPHTVPHRNVTGTLHVPRTRCPDHTLIFQTTTHSTPQERYTWPEHGVRTTHFQTTTHSMPQERYMYPEHGVRTTHFQTTTHSTLQERYTWPEHGVRTTHFQTTTHSTLRKRDVNNFYM